MDVECTSCLNHDITTSLGLAHIPIFVKSTSTCYTGHRPNSVGVDSCAHPQQHIKVVKHFVYIWYGCGMHFTGVWSLNHDLATSQRLSHAPNFSKIPPPPLQVEQCKGAPICSSTAYQGAKTLFIHIQWMWGALHGGLEPQPWHYNITWAQSYPNFLKNTPDLHRRTSVRVHPYANPRQIKVIKHFVHIWYWCGMHSKWLKI
jgi:hypothetical protein